jgi:uncharacterized protein YbjT (DUF2867 family)
MNALVTGGTGFVGREILHQLRGAGHFIHLLVRDTQSGKAQEIAARYGARIRPGNILNAGSLPGACHDADAVIHLVGIISEVGGQTFQNVHARGTQNLIAAAQSAGVKRFIHMSALGTRPNAVARYHKSKWEAEESVRGSGLDWTIFRPSIIYGRGDGFVNQFAKIIRRSPVVPIPGGGQSRFQPVAVETVAAAFVKALNETQTIGQTYDLCGPETLTLNEIVNEVLLAMRRTRLKLHIPLPLLRAQAALLELVFARLFHKPPPLNRDQITMLREDNVGNPQPAEKVFGLNPVSFREGIARYLQPASQA